MSGCSYRVAMLLLQDTTLMQTAVLVCFAWRSCLVRLQNPLVAQVSVYRKLSLQHLYYLVGGAPNG